MIEQKEAAEKQKLLGLPPAPSSNNLPTVPVPANPPINTSLLLPLNRLVDLMEAQVAKETLTIPETKVVVIPAMPTAVAVTPKSEAPSPKPSAASASKASTEAAENVQEKSEAQVKPETKAKINSSSSAKAEAKTKLKASVKTTAQDKSEKNSEPQLETKVESEPETETPTQPVSLPPPIPVKIPATETVVPSEIKVPINTLVGILELGERSAALFEIDGVARRIYVGENIGGSGWTLVEVVNQEAVVRRNGEVRSVFVGQQF